MLARSAIKVKHSAEAAQFLHSEIVLHEGDARGRVLKEKRSKMVIIKTVFKICPLIHAHYETYLNFFLTY
jgi:hypothetical protein